MVEVLPESMHEAFKLMNGEMSSSAHLRVKTGSDQGERNKTNASTYWDKVLSGEVRGVRQALRTLSGSLRAAP